MLGEHERSHFNRDGWLRVPGFLSSDIVEIVRTAVDALGIAALERLQSRTTSKDFPRLIVVPEAANPSEVCRYEYVLASHEKLRECLLPKLTQTAEELCGESFIPFKDKVNNKHPGGGVYRPHQDIVAYKAFPPEYHVTAMITIDASTQENGCLWVAENYGDFVCQHPRFVAHRIGSRAVLHNYVGGPFNGDIRSDIADGMRWTPLETGASDLVLIDSFVPHHSERNSSRSSRRSLFITFSLVRQGDWYEQYYQEKRQNPLDPKFHVSTPTRHDALDVGD